MRSAKGAVPAISRSPKDVAEAEGAVAAADAKAFVPRVAGAAEVSAEKTTPLRPVKRGPVRKRLRVKIAIEIGAGMKTVAAIATGRIVRNVPSAVNAPKELTVPNEVIGIAAETVRSVPNAPNGLTGAIGTVTITAARIGRAKTVRVAKSVSRVKIGRGAKSLGRVKIGRVARIAPVKIARVAKSPVLVPQAGDAKEAAAVAAIATTGPAGLEPVVPPDAVRSGVISATAVRAVAQIFKTY